MNKLFKKVILFFAGLFVVLGAYAQVTTSSMSGKVTDAAGAVIGVAVVATHTPSGTVYYSISDNSGNYRIMNILPGGPYSIKVEMLGYRKVEITDVNVSLADNYNLNLKLEEEAIGLDALVISAESIHSNMRSDRAGAVTAMDVRQINNVPTISRSINDLLKMSPNAYVSGSYAYIGGASYRSSFVTVDGSAFNNAFGIGSNLPAGGSPISLDALEQVSINITPYDVRQSGFTGGGISAVTRSGSNEYKASAYMYFNNQNMQGVKVGDIKLNRSDSRYLLYGARVGGPIIKNKLFFFMNLEIENSVVPGPSRVASTPENPYTNGSNNVARPSATVMDALGNYLSDTWKYNPGKYQDYSAKSPSFKFLGRIDWNINKDHKLNVRYSLSKSKNPSAPSTSTGGLGDTNFTTKSRTSMTAMYFQNARYYSETNYSSLAAELNSRFFNGALGNTFRASWSQQDDPRSTEGSQFPFVDVVVGANTYTSFGTELFSFGNLRYVNIYNVTEEVSYSMGKHNFLAGLQFEHNNTKNGFQRMGAGYYQFAFANETDFLNAINNKTVFNKPAQFAITHAMENPTKQAFPQFDFNQLSIYLQDDISFGDRFKISLGLRADLPMYPSLDTYNHQVANTVLRETNGNGGKYNTTTLPKMRIMWSPRLGFNWDVLGDRNFVIRGGTGIFTGRIPFVWIVSQAGDSGVLQTTVTRVAAKGEAVPEFTSDRNEMINKLYGGSYTPGSQMPISSCTIIDENLKMPQTWKSSLAFDVRLPWNIKGSLEGVYNYDINSTVVTNLGLKDPVWTLNDVDNRPIYGAYYDGKLQNAYMITNAQENGWYYSVTAKLEKSFHRGFSGMIAYSYSDARNVFDGSGDQPYSTWKTSYTRYGNNNSELSYAGYVMPHRLTAALSYNKDYAKYFGTVVSVYYNGGPQGRASYTYTSSIVGDGGTYNLIYIPNSKDELKFSDYKPDNWKTIYTAGEQREDFWNYINQDDYLKNRKGMYAQRNGVIYPWTNQFDIKVNQNFYINVAGKKNTIQVGLDIMNFANMLNSKWGNKYYVTNTALLKAVSGYSANSTEPPVYQFQANGSGRLTETFTKLNGYASTWSMQLNLRYIF